MDKVGYEHSAQELKDFKNLITKRVGDEKSIVDSFKKIYEYTRIYQKIPKGNGKLTLVFFYTKNFEDLYSQLKNIISKIPDNSWYLVNGVHKGWVFKTYNIFIRSTGNVDGCLGVPEKHVNKNAYGKILADAAERATCISLFKDINCADDTEQIYFKKHPEEFAKWEKTFKQTRVLLEKNLGIKFNDNKPQSVVLLGVRNENIYECAKLGSHDLKYEKLEQNLKIIAKLCGFKNFNSWCPADILIIETAYKDRIIQSFTNFIKYVQNLQSPDLNWIIKSANSLVWHFAKKKHFIPVSLKQIKDEGHFEEHIPSWTHNKDFHAIITKVQFNCDMSPFSGFNIGEFSFTNLILNDDKFVETKIRMQVRSRPNVYSYAQTEFLSDGTISGGRTSTCYKDKLKSILHDYDTHDKLRRKWPEDFTYTISQKECKYFSKWRDPFVLAGKVQEIMEMYNYVITFQSPNPTIKYKVINEYNLSEQELTNAIKRAQSGDVITASRMSQKIQGLSMQYFFLQHFSEISAIVSEMVTHAKKISKENCYFVKIS